MKEKVRRQRRRYALSKRPAFYLETDRNWGKANGKWTYTLM